MGWESRRPSPPRPAASAAAHRLRFGLDADTGLGVLRYADAGYPAASLPSATMLTPALWT
jgi:urocanate hydratase